MKVTMHVGRGVAKGTGKICDELQTMLSSWIPTTSDA